MQIIKDKHVNDESKNSTSKFYLNLASQGLKTWIPVPFVEAALTFPFPLATARLPILINPLSPKSDQHQFSPNCININTSSREKVRRINKMMKKGEML